MPVGSVTVMPSELQASGARPAARCKEPPAHIKRPAVLLDDVPTSSTGSVGGPKSPPAVPEVSPQAPASTVCSALSASHAFDASAAAAAALSVEAGQSLEHQKDAVLDGLVDADDDIADFDGPPAKSPPPQSPFYRVMPAPKPTETELAAALPPPAPAPPLGATEEGLVPTKAMPARCRAVPESCHSGAPPVAVSLAADSSHLHKGRYKAPPAELARRPTDGERWAEAESGAQAVAPARIKAPPVAATARVKAVSATCPAQRSEQGTHEGQQQRGPVQTRTKAFPGKPPAACGGSRGEYASIDALGAAVPKQ